MKTNIKVIHNLKTLARINNKSKEIEVSPRYNLLTNEMKDFVVLNLEFLLKTKGDVFDADKKTMDKIKELYPKKNNAYWVKEFANVLYNEMPNKFNFNRVESVCKFLKHYR